MKSKFSTWVGNDKARYYTLNIDQVRILSVASDPTCAWASFVKLSKEEVIALIADLHTEWAVVQAKVSELEAVK